MSVFSVIISVYNKENYIGETIKSVLNQSFKAFELIVVNDGSTDRSLDIITSIDDDRIQVITTENYGASSCRNTGIKAAKHPFIALLDGDDLWDQHYLNEMHQCIQSFPKQSVFATAIAQKYQTKIVPAHYSFEQKNLFEIHNYFESSLDQSILTSSSVVLHKSSFEKIGYFDTSVVSGEDTDLWIRIGLQYQIVFINKILAYYRYVPNSLSNTVFNLSKKTSFDTYKTLEAENVALKTFLDNNRYSFALMSKIHNQPKAFKYYKSELNLSNLPLKKQLLLHMPKWILELLLWLKSFKKERLYYKPM